MSAFLLALIGVIAVLDWISFALQTRAALRQDRRSTVLVERAGVSLLLALATSVYIIVGINTELGFPAFDFDAAIITNRVLLVVIGLIPARWLYLYFTRGFTR